MFNMAMLRAHFGRPALAPGPDGVSVFCFDSPSLDKNAAHFCLSVLFAGVGGVAGSSGPSSTVGWPRMSLESNFDTGTT
jgi:hypothetical protein